jgi:L-lactate dehydrogenase complex protein LldG
VEKARGEAIVSGRDTVLGTIRRALGTSANDGLRRQTIEDRISRHQKGIVPKRGEGSRKDQIALFKQMIENAFATVSVLASEKEIPAAVVAHLRSKNLPMEIRRGTDPRLDGVPWDSEKTLTITTGPSDGKQLAAISHAFGGVAETGTLVMVSGPENPTTLSFLPEYHIVVLKAPDLAGNYEAVWERIREKYGPGNMPRTVNWISGPSRTADIEQILLQGAHGPRGLHVLVIDQ